MKNFRQDLQKFEQFLKDGKHFTFSKYADGEWRILDGDHIDLTRKANGEFKYQPDNIEDELRRAEVLKSFQYIHSDYYVGIGCYCCMGNTFYSMKDLSKQPVENLTWANLFVNGNYKYYRSTLVPLFNDYKIIMVCNHKAKLDKLPFKVEKDFRVGTNAWLDNKDLVKEIIEYSKDLENYLFLFCAGPFGNILAHRLHEANPNNTYLDAGSTFDVELFGGGTRGYLIGADTLKKKCIWK